MAHENRIHQLEDIANKDSRHEGRYGDLVKGEMSSTSSQNGVNHLVPVPVTLKAQLGSPVWPHYFQLSHVLRRPHIDTEADSFCYRGLLDHFYNIITFVDGVARCHHHQCLHRQLLLCCRFDPLVRARSGHGIYQTWLLRYRHGYIRSVGARLRQHLRLHRPLCVRLLLRWLRCYYNAAVWSHGLLWSGHGRI